MDTKKIGAFIACKRKEKGFTQQQLAEKLGVTNKTISRWENGNYMPDLSLLVPLSELLNTSLNELLAGETVSEIGKEMYLENNLRSSIECGLQTIQKEKKRSGNLLILIGILLCMGAFLIPFAMDYGSAIVSIAGIGLALCGLLKRREDKTIKQKIKILIPCFLICIMLFYLLDTLLVFSMHRIPIYGYKQTFNRNETSVNRFSSLFYNVYQIHPDTPNEYILIDSDKKYSIKNLAISPFNKTLSGIEKLLNYHSAYLGDTANTGALINILPLHEYGPVFEIDEKEFSLTIQYATTDWYINHNHSVEKALLYNSVAIFSLIDNVQSIHYSFSGSRYTITRTTLEQQYPKYTSIVKNKKINSDNFTRYVERKLNDSSFVKEYFFKLFQ